MDKKIDSYTVEGFWDCSYCRAKGIGGLNRTCPNCGQARGADTEFYLVDISKEAAIAHETLGPDWYCEYCRTLNSAESPTCKSCGSLKREASRDYFTIQEERDKRLEEKEASLDQDESAVRRKPNKSLIFLLIGILVFAGIFALLFSNSPKTVEVSNKLWSRDIDIEAYETVSDSDWTLPANARLSHTNQEVKSYRQEFSHYETRTRQVPEQVFDGYDTYQTTHDNGDGTFRIDTHQSPRYRTEYRNETYQEPVYVNVPIYDTKYYYEQERWVHKRTVHTEGKDIEPLWGEANLASGVSTFLGGENKLIGQEREGDRKETYEFVDSDGKTYPVSLKDWESVKTGEEIRIQRNDSGIYEIVRDD